MTKLLIRLFAKGDPDQPATRAKTGKLSGTVGILCNVLLCVLKLVVGTMSGSVSITADAMNNLSDATSSIVTLLGCSFVGGALGGLMGMYLFRHKTRKDYFTLGLPLMLVMQAAVIFFLMNM